MEKELKISVENARKAYKKADQNGKEIFEELFGKEVFKPQNIMERVKTFKDACEVLGGTHPYVMLYNTFKEEVENLGKEDKDVGAYLKLRIIVAALNEGWKPQYTSNECRYYPWFYLYTKKEYDRLSEEKKKDCCLLGGGANYDARAGFVASGAYDGLAYAGAYIGSRLCFKSEELATYCAKQFLDIWFEYFL